MNLNNILKEAKWIKEGKDSNKELIITSRSSSSDIAKAKELIKKSKDNRFSKKKIDTLFNSVNEDTVIKIKVDNNGYFYYYTADGGVFDPGNYDIHPDSATIPRTSKGLAKLLLKRWVISIWHPKKKIHWRSKSNVKYGGGTFGDIEIGGKFVGNSKDEKEVAKILKKELKLKK